MAKTPDRAYITVSLSVLSELLLKGKDRIT